MLRRLCALMLVLACALAPVLPAHPVAANAAEKSCDCDQACCAGNRECAPPAPTPVRSAPATLASVEQGVNLARPAKRVVLLAFIRDLAHAHFQLAVVSTPARVATPARIVPADSAALFQAHCSFLI